jgi:hypothetical protein
MVGRMAVEWVAETGVQLVGRTVDRTAVSWAAQWDVTWVAH